LCFSTQLDLSFRYQSVGSAGPSRVLAGLAYSLNVFFLEPSLWMTS
jgi:hypothetical protein